MNDKREAATPPDAGYVMAFYELAKLMGIGARTESPGQVWRKEMLPRLAAALAKPPEDAQVAFSEDDSRQLWSDVINAGRALADRDCGAFQSEIREAAAMHLHARINSLLATLPAPTQDVEQRSRIEHFTDLIMRYTHEKHRPNAEAAAEEIELFLRTPKRDGE